MKTLFNTSAIFILSMFIMSTSNAQVFNGGIAGGASFNSVELKNNVSYYQKKENLSGAEVGLYITYKAGALYVTPSAYASFLKGTVNASENTSSNSETGFELTTLEVPVMVGLKILPVLSVEAGPSWNYLMSYTDEINSTSVSFDRSSLGYRAGLKLNIMRFGIYAHYGGIINESNGGEYDLSRPSRLLFGVSFDLVNPK